MSIDSGNEKSVHRDNMIDIEKLVEEGFELIAQRLEKEQLASLLSSEIARTKGPETSAVSLVGGAASGKSTLAKEIAVELERSDIASDVISTDDFVVGDRSFRREHFEGKDPRAKYDFELLNKKISEIKQNKDPNIRIGVPTYDEARGLAIAAGEENFTHQIGILDVLIIEGDFPEVQNPTMVIYLHMPDEQRLQNRLNRDVEARRESDPEKIKENFYLRQETQHIPHTTPAINQATLLIDAAVSGDSWLFDVYRAHQNTELIVN